MNYELKERKQYNFPAGAKRKVIIIIGGNEINDIDEHKESQLDRVSCFIGILNLAIAQGRLSKSAQKYFNKYKNTSNVWKWYNNIPREILEEVYAVARKYDYYTKSGVCPVRSPTPCVSGDRLNCFIAILRLALRNKTLSRKSMNFFAKFTPNTTDILEWCQSIPLEIIEEIYAVARKYNYFNKSGVC